MKHEIENVCLFYQKVHVFCIVNSNVRVNVFAYVCPFSILSFEYETELDH